MELRVTVPDGLTSRADWRHGDDLEAVFVGSDCVVRWVRTLGWTVFDGRGDALVHAVSSARHPATVDRGEWRDAASEKAVPDALCVEYASLGSFEQPLDIERLGLDAFTRDVVSRPVWFSVDGQVRHSGSKRAAETNLPGERYCDLCGRCVSANNFWSQHMKRVHARERRYVRSVMHVQEALLYARDQVARE